MVLSLEAVNCDDSVVTRRLMVIRLWRETMAAILMLVANFHKTQVDIKI